MKAKFLTIAMAIFLGSFVTSCDKNDDEMAAPSAGISSTSSTDGTEQAPEQAAGRMGEEMTVSGKYVIAKFSNRGENITNLYKDVKFSFGDNGIMYATSPRFSHKGQYGVSVADRVMKMHIEGNDLMNMVSGYYRITQIAEDGKVYLVSEDGTKSIVFSRTAPKGAFTTPVKATAVRGE